MARNKTAQGGISLRRKVTAWLAAILLVTMLSTGIATMAGQWTVRSFDMLLADNAVCYTVQNALKDETQAFARYVRQPTSENRPIPPPAPLPSRALQPCPSIMPASARSAMPAHGIFCKGMRAIGRSGMPFCSFPPRQIPILNRCTM